MIELVNTLKEHGLTISSCESFTAGLFCSKIGEVSGASSVLKGGIVTYTNEAKIRLAQVDEDVIRRYGAVSEQCVIQMARNVKEMFQSDIGVSFSGNAGPSPSEGKAVGLIYCAIAYLDNVKVFKLQLDKSRNEIRDEAVFFVANQVILNILGKGM